jgi:hypothetical protein
MTPRRAIFALSLFATLLWATVASAQNVQLRYRWNKGEEIRYRMTMQTSMNANLPLQGVGDLSIKTATTSTIRIVVDDVAADGKVTLKETIEAVHLESESNAPGAPPKTVYDSASGIAPTDPAAQGLAAIIGQPITFVMLPSGAAEKVEGMNQIMEKVLGGQPGAAAGAAAAGLDLRRMFSDENMNNMFADFFPFPDRALETGDTWDRRRTVDMPILGKMTNVETLTLRSVENGIAHIGIARSLTQESPGGLGPIIMKIEYTPTDGELLFDVAKGRLQRTTGSTAQSITMTFTPPPGANLPPGAIPEIPPMKSTTSIVMELLQGK